MAKSKTTLKAPQIPIFLKMLAMSIFIILPFIGFFFGMNYQKKLSRMTKETTPIKNSYVSPTPENKELTYYNDLYNFQLKLPSSWQGYQIINDDWIGEPLANTRFTFPLTGPQILLLHPRWTKTNPRQDIPIMIFTQAQWDSMEQGNFHIGAAPINPTEVFRNKDYIFAVPARYNYAYLEGWEEVESILVKSNFGVIN